MCRIDAPFGNHTLDEKVAPTERFVQALDEYMAIGGFRSLLTKHFSETWVREFGSAQTIEEALKRAQNGTSDGEKCSAFLGAAPIARKLANNLLDKHIADLRPAGTPDEDAALIKFAKDVAKEYFPESPYAFFSSIFGGPLLQRTTTGYVGFVIALYGNEFCFSTALFGDEALMARGDSARTDILWDFFNAMSCRGDDHRKDPNQLVDNQINNVVLAASLERQAGAPTRATHEFLKGVRFLNTWVKCDVESGRLRTESDGVFNKLSDEWSDLRSRLKSLESMSGADGDEDSVNPALKWLDDTKTNLWGALYLHRNLNEASGDEIDLWASELDSHFESRKWSNVDVLSAAEGEFRATESKFLERFCSQLSPFQIDTWIRWCASLDIQSQLAFSGKASIRNEFLGLKSQKWWATEYSGSWKDKFHEEFNDLGTEAKLTVLSGHLRLDTERAHGELRDWWNGLLEGLIQSEGFPATLVPKWTIAAMGRFDEESMVPFIDKSIGMLRGELSREGQSDHHQQLEALLQKLDFHQPSKALRHRLMLMRSSHAPFSDDSISPSSSWHSRDAIAWYQPMRTLAQQRFATMVNFRVGVGAKDVNQVQTECLTSFSLELVEFCLSRLRLRKGEKPTEGSYDESQVTETSAIWRQGYLKALMELGFDSKGRVHKTVFFTKQADPDEDVRVVAKECYRAVRRESKKSRSIEDLKRGIIAAEWWLLICQRRELNLDVNYEGALKTRRNLLRNP